MSETVDKREAKLAQHPKDLSPEYHKAHKQLMLWAAILFVWEFVGIDLDKAKDAEGYAGALIKSIRSPQAVPWVLLVLVVYFLFKCSTEWAQCHLQRRKMRFARVDFISAWLVSLIAIALYVGQAISRVQFADSLHGWAPWIALIIGTLVGAFFGGSVFAAWLLYDMRQKPARNEIWLLLIGPAMLILSVTISRFLGLPINWPLALAGMAVGAFAMVASVTREKLLAAIIKVWRHQ
ncbi:MAG TPA: hypothetical protein VIW64_03615 [Pyrinomonadaceae bacterium]|jgi:hypothetical protein